MPRTRSDKVTIAKTPTHNTAPLSLLETPPKQPPSTSCLVSPPLQRQVSSATTPPPQNPTSASQEQGGTPYFLARHYPKVLEQLILDIEQIGGITALYDNDKHELSRILDERPEIYGTTTSNPLLRKKIRNRVYRWHLLDKKGKYAESILKELSLRTQAADTEQFWGPSSTEFTSPVLVSHSVKSDTPPSSPESSISSLFSRQLSLQQTEEAGQANSSERNTMGRNISTNQTPLPKSTARITVDLKNPAANREAMVFPLENIPSTDGKSVHSGYYIMHPLDNRYLGDDTEVDFYRARVFSSSSVLIKVPAWPYSILFNRDEIEADGVHECVKNALDDARHCYFDDKTSRQWKYILLEFPEGHELSSKEITLDTDDGGVELELEVLEIEFSHDAVGNGTECWAAWKVARQDTKARKRGKVETGKKISKAALLLAEKRKRKKASVAAPLEQVTSSSWFATNDPVETGEPAHGNDGNVDDLSLMDADDAES